MKIRKLAIVLAPALMMAATTIQGPQLGFVFDNGKKEIRPILGIPGAAVLGNPLETGAELRLVAISPAQNYALAVAGEHNQVVLLAIGHSPVTSVAITGADPGPDQIILSVAGKAAALLYKDKERIEIVGGLPTAPKVTSELILSAGQSLSAIAVSDDGATVLAAVGGTVYHLTAGSEVPVLTGLSNVSALVMSSSSTAFVADSGQNQIHRVQGIGGSSESDVIAGPHDGISNPVAIAVATDNSRVFVANGKAATLSTIAFSAQTSVSHVACGFTPTGIERLAGSEVFRLTEVSSAPMWVMEASGREPRFLFVPAASAGSGQQ